MTKNDFELAQSLAVFIDARKHIQAYPSIAEDTGTTERTFKHFLERVLNSKNAELAPSQAAAIALGFNSSMHTHSYVNFYAWDFERLVRILAAGGSTLADEIGECADEDENEGAEDENEGATQACAEEGQPVADDTEELADDAEELAGELGVDHEGAEPRSKEGGAVSPDPDLEDLDLDTLCHRGRHGKCNVYTIKVGGELTRVVASQAEHYAWRDPKLHPMSPEEFAMSMVLVPIEKLSPKQREAHAQEKLNEAHEGGGRPRSWFWELLPPHKLAGLYLLKRKARFDVPILIGDPPPRLPTRVKAMGYKKQKRQHATYFTATSRPWHGAKRDDGDTWALGAAGGDDGQQSLAMQHRYMAVDSLTSKELDSSPLAWDEFIADLEHDAYPQGGISNRAVLTEDVRRAHIARGRIFRIRNVECPLNAKRSAAAKIQACWRGRCSRIWTKKEREAKAQRHSAKKADDKSVQRAIDDERERAKACDKDSLACDRAARNEIWLDDAVGELGKAMEAIAASNRSGPFAAGSEGAPLPLPPGGVDELKAHVDRLKQVLEAPSQPSSASGDDGQPSNGIGFAADGAGDDGTTPPEFISILPAAFEQERRAWKTECADLKRRGLTELPPPPLNPKQRLFARKYLDVLRMLLEGRWRGEPRAATLKRIDDAGLRTAHLLLGAGGTGKSELIKALQRVVRRLRLGGFVVSAWTGVASAPFGSPTLTSMLGIDFMNLDELKDADEAQIAKMQSTFAAITGCEPDELCAFVIDEISFVEDKGLCQIDRQLRRLTGHDVPFGGVALIAAGDFIQLSPPGSATGSATGGSKSNKTGDDLTMSLATRLAAVDALKGKGSFLTPTGAAAQGIHLFRKMRRTVLTQPMRAADDPELARFQGYLESMRDLDAEQPVPSELINWLEALSVDDVRKDESWACAPIGVCTNLERHVLGLERARSFAKLHGRVLVRWRRTFVGGVARWLDEEQARELAENECGLMATFVHGAPAMLLSNAAGQPTKGLANGTTATFHSLTFEGETPAAYADALEQGGFHEIVLDAPPLSVNIVPSLPPRTDNCGIESLVSGTLVVPVLEEKSWSETHVCASHYAAVEGHVPKKVRYSGHPVTCALTLTSFKMQGGTFDKLIMSVHPRPFPPHLGLEAFYVFISRIRRLDNLRVLHKPPASEGGLDHLAELKHPPELRVWEKGYDEHGDWSAQRAQAAAVAERARAAGVPKTRKKPQRRHCTKTAKERVAAKRRAFEGGDGGAVSQQPPAKRQKCCADNGGGRSAGGVSANLAPMEVSSSAMGSGTIGGGSIPYSDGELEVEVDNALALLFAGACDECTFDELFEFAGRDPRVAVCGRDAVTRVLASMEAANKVMYRAGRVHLI